MANPVAALEALAVGDALAASVATLTDSSASGVAAEVGTDTLRPSHVDPVTDLSAEAFRQRPPWRVLLPAAIVLTAGAVWLGVRSGGSESASAESLETSKPLATQPVPRRPAPAPAAPKPAPPQASASAAASSNPQFAASFASALSGTPDMDQVSVTVHVSPSSAAIFRHGKRLGAGQVTLGLVRGSKTTLVAQLEGYLPRKLVVDTSTPNVNIVLERPGARNQTEEGSAAGSTATSAKPVARPTSGATTAAKPSAPTAAATASSGTAHATSEQRDKAPSPGGGSPDSAPQAPTGAAPSSPKAPAASASSRAWDPSDDLPPL